jgi:hypothetical protein
MHQKMMKRKMSNLLMMHLVSGIIAVIKNEKQMDRNTSWNLETKILYVTEWFTPPSERLWSEALVCQLWK